MRMVGRGQLGPFELLAKVKQPIVRFVSQQQRKDLCLLLVGMLQDRRPQFAEGADEVL